MISNPLVAEGMLRLCCSERKMGLASQSAVVEESALGPFPRVACVVLIEKQQGPICEPSPQSESSYCCYC